MNRMWLRQLGAVVRMELGKSFFSKRGLWIYLLALAPVGIFGGHSFEIWKDKERRMAMAKERPGATLAQMKKIEDEMAREDVIRILGEPAVRQEFGRRNRRTELLRYSDGVSEVFIYLREGEVVSVNLREGCSFAKDTTIFAVVYQFFFLRLLVFFGCVFVFLNLFRGEVLDKSLHYYFLAPVRREIVVAGKFLAGLSATSIIFGLSVTAQILVMNAHFDSAVLDEYLTRGRGWHDAMSYIGVTLLACAGYGSAFLAGGILLRNPLIPAAVLLLWESINGILPAVLRKFSVIFYLKSLTPVAIPLEEGVPPGLAMLAFGAEPVSPAVAIFGLLGVSLALLALAAFLARKLEINYAAE